MNNYTSIGMAETIVWK